MVPIAYGRTEALSGASGNQGGIDPRLKPAAHDFEASMMQELLKPMEHDPLFSSSSSGGGLMSGDASASTWSSLGAESLAKAISEAGGLGIATKIIQEVEAEAQQAQRSTAQDGKAGKAGTGALSDGKADDAAGNVLKRGEIPAAGAAERRIS